MAEPLDVVIIAPECKDQQPLRWLQELGGISRIAGVNMELIGGPTCTREVVSRAFEKDHGGRKTVMVWTGHGLPGGLAVPDETGATAFVSPTWLATQVKCAAPRAFVVATCNSLTHDDMLRSVVEAISLKGVNAVGYSLPANDEAAVMFNIEFCRMIARGASVGDAFIVARECAGEVDPVTAGGLFILPGITNGVGEIYERIAKLEDTVNTILELLTQGAAPKRQRAKPVGC